MIASLGTSCKKEFSMKNTSKLFGFIALVAVIGFSMSACGGDDNDGGGGGNGSLGNTLTITNAQVYSEDSNDQLVEFTGTVQNLNYVEVKNKNRDGDFSVLKSLNELIDGNPTVTLINGKLNVTLGTPKASSLENFDTSELPPGITVSTTGVKVFIINIFYDSPTWNDNRVMQSTYYPSFDPSRDTHMHVNYIYSNKDVNISGTYIYDEYSFTYTYAMNLKAGWNSVLETTKDIEGGFLSYKTGTPPSDCKWIIY